MTTLIQRQEACIARMSEPRTSEKRAAKNRAAALRTFRTQLVTAGYSLAEIDQQTQDVRAVYELRRSAEEE